MKFTLLDFELVSGSIIKSVDLEYFTIGHLNADKSNAILLFHVLTSSHKPTACPAKKQSADLDEGWWNDFIGPKKALDTEKYFIICVNYLGGCHGSTGPLNYDGKAIDFPKISIGDIAKSQLLLLDSLNINLLHAVVGASVGGLMALAFASDYPDRVARVISIGSGLRTTPLQRSLNLEQGFALELGQFSAQSLMLARLIALKTYLNLSNPPQKNLVDKSAQIDIKFYDKDDGFEAFLMENSKKFVDRFCPHSYYRIIKAWNDFEFDFHASQYMREQKWCVFSIEDDFCFPPDEQGNLCEELKSNAIDFEFHQISSKLGHDSFLKEASKYQTQLQCFLAA